MKWRVIFVALAAAGGIATAQAGEGSGPFTGAWTIAEAKPLPGTTPAGQPNATLMNAAVSIGRSQLVGPEPLSCARAMYSTDKRDAFYLFSGGLSAPEQQAKDLGFADKINILSIGCRTGTTAYPDIALVDERTAMFALDGYIYVMKR